MVGADDVSDTRLAVIVRFRGPGDGQGLGLSSNPVEAIRASRGNDFSTGRWPNIFSSCATRSLIRGMVTGYKGFLAIIDRLRAALKHHSELPD